MNQTLPRYIQRAPRYTLQANERTLVRYAGPKRLPWEEGTEIQDISLTGLAFTAPEELAPSLGEPIKVEFVEPGGRQLACLARVSRIEKKKDMVLVACEFEDLFSAQKFMLSQSLNKKLKDQKQQMQSQVFRLALILLFQNKKKVAMLLLSLCLFAAALYFMFF